MSALVFCILGVCISGFRNHSKHVASVWLLNQTKKSDTSSVYFLAKLKDWSPEHECHDKIRFRRVSCTSAETSGRPSLTFFLSFHLKCQSSFPVNDIEIASASAPTLLLTRWQAELSLATAASGPAAPRESFEPRVNIGKNMKNARKHQFETTKSVLCNDIGSTLFYEIFLKFYLFTLKNKNKIYFKK